MPTSLAAGLAEELSVHSQAATFMNLLYCRIFEFCVGAVGVGPCAGCPCHQTTCTSTKIDKLDNVGHIQFHRCTLDAVSSSPYFIHIFFENFERGADGCLHCNVLFFFLSLLPEVVFLNGSFPLP